MKFKAAAIVLHLATLRGTSRPPIQLIRLLSGARILFMRSRLFLMLALLVTAAMNGCTTAPEHFPVRAGMTSDDLQFFYGKPLRIEPDASGGEDWYYTFVSWSKPEVGGTSWHDPAAQSSTVAVDVSSTRTREDLPIHLSKDGYVIEPIPIGKIVGR